MPRPAELLTSNYSLFGKSISYGGGLLQGAIIFLDTGFSMMTQMYNRC